MLNILVAKHLLWGDFLLKNIVVYNDIQLFFQEHV